MATVRMPISRQVRATRTAISPRFAMRILRMATRLPPWRGEPYQKCGFIPIVGGGITGGEHADFRRQIVVPALPRRVLGRGAVRSAARAETGRGPQGKVEGQDAVVGKAGRP